MNACHRLSSYTHLLSLCVKLSLPLQQLCCYDDDDIRKAYAVGGLKIIQRECTSDEVCQIIRQPMCWPLSSRTSRWLAGRPLFGSICDENRVSGVQQLDRCKTTHRASLWIRLSIRTRLYLEDMSWQGKGIMSKSSTEPSFKHFSASPCGFAQGACGQTRPS